MDSLSLASSVSLSDAWPGDGVRVVGRDEAMVELSRGWERRNDWRLFPAVEGNRLSGED